MALSKTNNISKARGFTLVELLIVIVVIAILATISIVAYNGIQNRAKTTAGNELASQIIKKLEALNAVKGSYTTATNGAASGQAINTAAGTEVPEAKLDNPDSVVGATSATNSGFAAASDAANGTKVAAYTCDAGAVVWYWDYTASAVTTTPMIAGQGC